MKHCYKNHAHSFVIKRQVKVGDVISSYLGLRRVVAVEEESSPDGYFWVQTMPASILQRIKFALYVKEATKNDTNL